MGTPFARRRALAALLAASSGAGAAALLGATSRAVAATPSAADTEDDLWPTLATDLFGGRKIGDGNAVVGLDAPYRAEDAAIVPLTLHLLRPSVEGSRVRRITLVVDENPSPLVAGIELGPAAGITRITTAVRVNAYTTVHLVAETEAGGLFATSRFVKAAGGCSAPAVNASADGIPIGTLRFRQFAARRGAADADANAEGARPEAQIMVRHPNYSGMQMDQLTHYYIPAHYVRSIKLWQGEAPLIAVDTGISMSENPFLRFDYTPNGAARFRAEVRDSTGALFSGTWPATPAT